MPAQWMGPCLENKSGPTKNTGRKPTPEGVSFLPDSIRQQCAPLLGAGSGQKRKLTVAVTELKLVFERDPPTYCWLMLFMPPKPPAPSMPGYPP